MPLSFCHPNAPCDWSGLVIGYEVARQLEGKFDLTVMVALVPEHVLKQENWMIVVNVHGAVGRHPASYGIPHHLRAIVQHMSDAIAI